MNDQNYCNRYGQWSRPCCDSERRCSCCGTCPQEFDWPPIPGGGTGGVGPRGPAGAAGPQGPAEEKPTEEKPAETKLVLYRVQAGAFRVKNNAETLLEKLRAAGFVGYITTQES